MKLIWLLLFIVSTSHSAPANKLFIIVPGTWSTNQPWYTINGDFFEAFKQTLPNDNYQLIWFRWLAQNSDKHRKQAVREFAHFIRSLPSSTVIHVIAHSHGVNVVLGASQLLARRKSTRTIATLYALGAPIHEEEYAPNMRIIKRIYNLYSLNDPIQTIWGYQRIFIAHPEIFNIRVFVDNHEPTHEELHSPIIGKWLTMLPLLTCPNNAIIHFYTHNQPLITPDNQQELAHEKPLNLATIFETRKKIKSIES
jgi:hypothetical protein